MRIAHLADSHLGYRRYSRLNERGLNQREADVGSAFVSAIDSVVAARPDAVIIAGDLFHQVRPTNSAILLAIRQFVRLSRELPDSPVIVIAGNHDTPRSSDTVSIFGLLNEVGVHVAAHEARRLEFGELDLSVLAVPHKALFESSRPAMEPDGPLTHQVLVLHGETPGLFGPNDPGQEPGGAHLLEQDIAGGPWSYVALGHYHVRHQVRERVWYSGSLDYVSPNPWGELHEEHAAGIEGKGWLLVDLEEGTVVPQLIERPRRVIDLPYLDAADLAATELDRLLQGAVDAVPGGIEDAVVRQVVRNVHRSVGRELDHAVIRRWKASALDFRLDLRRPEARDPDYGVAAPGGGEESLATTVQKFLAQRSLPEGIDREAFVADGMAAFEAASADPEGD